MSKLKTKKGWRFKGNELKYVKQVLHRDFASGSEPNMNEKLERLFAKKHNQKYSVTANSGTSTLHMALNAFGVGHGDEVIIPSLTVAMCGYAVWQCGAVPVYADVDPNSFLICTTDIEKKITKKTKAIMVVHLYGLMCDMDKIIKIARKHSLKIIEDCAQCFLGKDDKGRIAGAVGDVGSWSFEVTKHIATGDGGIVTTDNTKFAESMRKFGSAGYKNLTANSGKIRIDKDKFQDPNWRRHDMLSYNYRLSEICAAVGLGQLENINFFLRKRIASGKAFLNAIKQSKTKIICPQVIPKGYKHAFYTFPVRFEGKEYGIEWQEFRKKFMEYGGDGIYAAWTTVDQEPPFLDARKEGLVSGSMKISQSYGWGNTPCAHSLQKKIMQFTTNQKNQSEVDTQIKALKKTITFFGV